MSDGYDPGAARADDLHALHDDPMLAGVDGGHLNPGYGWEVSTVGYGPGTATIVDVDHDGRSDVVALDRDGDGRVDEVAVDRNHDGKVDLMIEDTDLDGRFDVVRVDADFDGTVDYEITDGFEPAENPFGDPPAYPTDGPFGVLPDPYVGN